MISKITKEQKNSAFLLGVIAFGEGKKCIPAFDKELMNMFVGLKVGEGSANLSKQWLKGWHSANLLVN